MISLYLVVLLVLGLYSYSQIDLNLTLFSAPQFLSFQNAMIQLGYFHRPLSAFIFLLLIFMLHVLYFILLRKPARLNHLFFWGICLVGILSYPAFSHDIFNYLFDAKILTYYSQNPYFFKALDFPADPWLRFMHWTHRTYPYGPVWLAATAPLSILGFGKFVLTLFNFKLFFTAVYLLNVKLLQKLSPQNFLLFALNPLVIIESLVSPHVDAFMTLLMLAAFYLWQKKSKTRAVFALLLSGGTKFVTFLLLPFLGRWKIAFFVLLAATAIVIGQREVYPWYFLPIFAVVSLIDSPLLKNLAFAASFGLLLRYVPFLYVGREVLFWENILTVTPVLLCGLGLFFFRRS